MQLLPGQHIHCIGIGGYGISAIARILLERGFAVSGSDRNSNTLTEALARDGATIYTGHSAEYVQTADMVIATSAVGDNHVEIVAAREQNIPVYRRRDILAPLTEGNLVIAVAGTHGKTTTTAMIVHILRECGQDPSYIVGGIMANTGTNAGVGQGDIFVIEADEYDHMFLGLRPHIAVITSVEYDHPDFFRSETELVEAFRRFLDLLRPPPTEQEGDRFGYPRRIVVCADSQLAWSVFQQKHQSRTHADNYRVSVYGVENLSIADYQGRNIRVGEDGNTEFDFVFPDGAIRYRVSLPLPGEHNVLNAMAAMLAVGDDGLSADQVLKAFKTFKSTGRRFEIRGEVNGVIVIDDYAHHPTAIRVTLGAARQRYLNHEIWAVWQPHMYSRTQILIDKYAAAFAAADHVAITDIFAAREDPLPGVDGAWTASMIQHPDVHHAPSLSDATELLVKEVRPPAVILIMSAGDAPQIGVEYLKLVRSKAD